MSHAQIWPQTVIRLTAAAMAKVSKGPLSGAQAGKYHQLNRLNKLAAMSQKHGNILFVSADDFELFMKEFENDTD